MHVVAVNAETRPLADADASHVHASVLARGDHGPHQVPGAEPQIALAPRQVAHGETVAVGTTRLSIAVPAGRDEQRTDTPYLQQGRTRTDTRGVQPVRLGQALLRAVERGAPARAGLQGQAEAAEATEERPARDVDRSGVLKRCLRPGLHL